MTLTGLSHTFPDDIDILLAGPAGRTMLLMSDAGGNFGVNNVNLTFDDVGASLPVNTAIASGTFRPSNFGSSS